MKNGETVGKPESPTAVYIPTHRDSSVTMNRRQRTALLLAAIAAIAMVGLAGTVSAHADESNDSVAPGERLSGVIGMQNAELDGEVDERSFQSQLATAESDDERAALIAERYDAVNGEHNDIDAALAELRDARDAGTITHGQYQAQVAVIDAQSANAERAAQSMGNSSAELPASLLEANGVNVTAIEELRANASELRGQEVAEIARSIGGPPADVPGHDERPGGPSSANESVGGPPADVPGHDERPAGPPSANESVGGPPVDSPGGDGDNRGPPANESPGSDDSDSTANDAAGGPPADGQRTDTTGNNGPGQSGSAGQPSSQAAGNAPGR